MKEILKLILHILPVVIISGFVWNVVIRMWLSFHVPMLSLSEVFAMGIMYELVNHLWYLITEKFLEE